MRPRYGQHFLRSGRAVASILEAFSVRAHDRVVEIGPGKGALTLPLAGRVEALAAIEIDPLLGRALARALGATLLETAQGPEPGPWLGGGGRTTAEPSCRTATRLVLRADALEVRYADLAPLLGASAERPLRVIGNLPYAIATALIQRMIAERHLIEDALLMVQKEVADRLLAPPGCKQYGFLSVLLALSSERRRILTLGPGAFTPPPRVRSTVVSLRFHRPPNAYAEDDDRLIRILKLSLAERRKKLAANLAKGLGLGREHVARTLAHCGADPDARAEAVTPETFARLAAAFPSLSSPGISRRRR